jgi:hypothetical protein
MIRYSFTTHISSDPSELILTEESICPCSKPNTEAIYFSLSKNKMT